jgi:23S rRNA (guanosine2251-2'-O)-methyltransferase
LEARPGRRRLRAPGRKSEKAELRLPARRGGQTAPERSNKSGGTPDELRLPARRGGQTAPQRGQEGTVRRGPTVDRGSANPLIHGRNAVLEAARAGRVVKVYQASGLGHDPRLDELGKLARIEVVAPDRLDVMAPGVHQGVAAELKPRRIWTLKHLLATSPNLLIALDSIMDPQNLGAILRSAEVAGCDGAILPDHRSAPLSPAAVKASSGATELLRIANVSGMPSAIAEVKRSDIWCVALDPRGEMPAWEFDFTQRVCIVVGSEGEGVHRLVRERCDVRVRLPVKGHIASFNASAAAAALLYEVMRQRSKSG